MRIALDTGAFAPVRAHETGRAFLGEDAGISGRKERT